jgi:hypothetical protein
VGQDNLPVAEPRVHLEQHAMAAPSHPPNPFNDPLATGTASRGQQAVCGSRSRTRSARPRPVRSAADKQKRVNGPLRDLDLMAGGDVAPLPEASKTADSGVRKEFGQHHGKQSASIPQQ